MTLEELREKQRKEWKEFMAEYKKSLDVFLDEKFELRKAYDFEFDKIPKNIRNLIESRTTEFEKEWGTDGWRTKQLIKNHDREARLFFGERRVRQMVQEAKNRIRQNDNGRE